MGINDQSLNSFPMPALGCGHAHELWMMKTSTTEIMHQRPAALLQRQGGATMEIKAIHESANIRGLKIFSSIPYHHSASQVTTNFCPLEKPQIYLLSIRFG
jgi:hypothetical protein